MEMTPRFRSLCDSGESVDRRRRDRQLSSVAASLLGLGAGFREGPAPPRGG